jgi:hypothetical protein
MRRQAFRWIEWNVGHATKHGCTVAEIESVLRNAGHGFPRKRDAKKWLVIGRGHWRKNNRSRLPSRRRRRSFRHPRDATHHAPQAGLKRITMKKKSAIDEFIALPDSEKERIVEEIEAETAEERLAKSRPLNASERAAWNAFRRKAGRPNMGKNGVEKVSISVEQSLLKEADRYARKHKLNRSELFRQGVERLIRS